LDPLTTDRKRAGSTNGSPFVSVVTPVYNGADFIAECIESVLNQTYSNFEYLIVNNCSKDRTLEIVRSYEQKDRRIRVFDNETFLSIVANHNHAFRLIPADAKYCKVVSADDWLYPECIERMVGFAEANPSAGIVNSYSIAGARVLPEGIEYERSLVDGREICRATLLGGPYLFGAPTMLLYRADLVRSRPDFFPGVSPHGDTSACYECLDRCDFGFVHQILSYTRVHAQSETSNSLSSGKLQRAMIADMVEYGPRYLSPEEIKDHLNARLGWYYDWLAMALLERSLDRAFLRAQAAELKALGFELSPTRLLRAALEGSRRLALRPWAKARKLASLVRRGGKVVPRYFQ
jgi:glycosyltransferase involved in cell wall biosynthesis